ncbi:hypothetical protein ACFWOX_11140 [Streptomyces sp. NPDC058467]|uniref:hypothetical protein n=1 Tax=unclassified Streptomyces TaxID=2593676 RepID=UPI0036479D38
MTLRKLAPPPALCGFLLLLVLIFTVSYAIGVTAGPVAPGLHGPGPRGGGTDGGTDGGGAGGSGGMEDMHGGGPR